MRSIKIIALIYLTIGGSSSNIIFAENIEALQKREQGKEQRQSSPTLLREDFNDLLRWEPLTFKKIPKHSTYSIKNESEDVSYLQAETKNSASGLTLKKFYNIKEFPILRWRWKISNVFRNGNVNSKKGDDYPIRIYVNFAYDPEKSGFFEATKYKAAKLVFGEYPPHSALNYIWANNAGIGQVINSPYIEQSKMIPVNSGSNQVNKWITHEVNVLQDYRRAFGEEPPDEASLAIMSDSDNTGERATAYLDFIEVKK